MGKRGKGNKSVVWAMFFLAAVMITGCAAQQENAVQGIGNTADSAGEAAQTDNISDETQTEASMVQSSSEENSTQDAPLSLTDMKAHCQEVIKRFSQEDTEAEYIKKDTIVSGGKPVKAYIFSDSCFQYQVVPERNDMLMVDCTDTAGSFDIEQAKERMRAFLDIRYELQAVVEDPGYLHVREVQNGVDTGAYAIISCNQQGKMYSMTLFKGSNYDVALEDLVSKEEAFQTAAALLEEGITISGKTIPVTIDREASSQEMELTAIVDHLYYVGIFTVYPKEDESVSGGQYYIEIQIDAYTGACAEVNVGL